MFIATTSLLSVALLFLNPSALPNHAVALVVGGGVMLLIAQGYKSLRNKDGLGMGDVKLMAAYTVSR